MLGSLAVESASQGPTNYEGLTPVGFINNGKCYERATSSISHIADKLEFYIYTSKKKPELTGREIASWRTLPFGVYAMPKEPMYMCKIDGCREPLMGVYLLGKWVFPWGILHNIKNHKYLPPVEFLEDLAKLPDPPSGWKEFRLYNN